MYLIYFRVFVKRIEIFLDCIHTYFCILSQNFWSEVKIHLLLFFLKRL